MYLNIFSTIENRVLRFSFIYKIKIYNIFISIIEIQRIKKKLNPRAHAKKIRNRNQHPRKPLYTNFHNHWKFFAISFRHIGSTILNFENLTAYSKSVTQKPSI